MAKKIAEKPAPKKSAKKIQVAPEEKTIFNVTRFSVEGTGENAGVILVGTKRLSDGDYVALKTPKRMWTGSYAFINELRVVIDDLLMEVEEYMNGKAAHKMVQQDLFEEKEEGEA